MTNKMTKKQLQGILFLPVVLILLLVYLVSSYAKQREALEITILELQEEISRLQAGGNDSVRNQDLLLNDNLSNQDSGDLFDVEEPDALDEALGSDPVMVSTVKVGSADSPPPMTDATLNAIQRFDYAMDREFDRLDQREESSADSTEVATINTIKEKLGELDELYIRADLATNTEERIALRKEMQQTMGSIIGLSRRDRNERLYKLATDIGYTDPQALEQFVREIDRVYRETHMDWTKLFNRTPPAMAPAGDRSVSPGMQSGDVEPSLMKSEL